MNTYISLLRGINVSGQKKIKMNDLAKLYEDAGFTQVKTYIQSGNVIFQSLDSVYKAVNTIQDFIKKNYGFSVHVTVISQEELKDLIEKNPFILSGIDDIKSLHVTILSRPAQNDNMNEIKDFKDGENQFKIIGKNIYLYCPNGYGKVKINNTFFEKKLNIQATTRNWKTILNLAEMTN